MRGLGTRVVGWVERVVRVVRRGERDARLDEELRFHIEMATERNIRAGMTAAEARRAALVAFGGRTRFEEEARDEYRSRWLEELGRDVRYALRGLRRAPVFTATAVLTLALGLGGTTVIYSVVDHVVLRPLTYEAADRLVVVREVARELSEVYPTLPANASHYLEWRERCEVCEDVAALTPIGVTVTDQGDPARLGAVRASANLFPLLGVSARIGRLFTEEEDRSGGGDVAVLSDAYWRRQFGADPSVIGRTLTLDGVPRVVIGVLPPDFRLPKGHELGELVSMPDGPEVFVPLALTPYEAASQGAFNYVALARLREGVTLAQAQEHFDRLQAAITERAPQGLTLSAAVVPLYEQVVGSAGRALTLLLGAVGGVLLIVCVNLAALVAARNASRAWESTVRAVLGAGRGRLVRQALVESLLLAMIGGAVGLVLARWGLAGLLELAPADLPRLGEVRLDARVLAVAAAATALVGLAFGMLPAFRYASADPGAALKSGGRTATAGVRIRRARSALIASQVGLVTVLLVVAGLFLVSFVRVLRMDRGFDSEHVLALDVVLPEAEYGTRDAQARFHDRALDRLRALPGVTAAAVTSRLPLEGETQVDAVAAAGDPRPTAQQPAANYRHVSPGYFAALGIPLRAGRYFEEADRERDVVILSERAAAVLWPGESAIGRRVVPGGDGPPAEVIGVVADVPTTSLEEPRTMVVYLPHWRGWLAHGTVLVRATGDPLQLAGPGRAELRREAPGAVIEKVRTVEQVVGESMARRRFQLVLLALFAAVALATVGVGVFGVVAHFLAGRRGEVGIRLALGARPRSIHWQVVREGLRPALIGIGLGAAASIALGRMFGSLLFEVRPGDPPTILGVAALLLALLVAMACYVPARRVTEREPIAALRME